MLYSWGLAAGEIPGLIYSSMEFDLSSTGIGGLSSETNKKLLVYPKLLGLD